MSCITLPNATCGTNYSQNLGYVCSTSVYSGSLPSGLTISGSGILSGTPCESGVFTFCLKTKCGKQRYSLTVECQVVRQPDRAFVSSEYEDTPQTVTLGWVGDVTNELLGASYSFSSPVLGIPSITSTYSGLETRLTLVVSTNITLFGKYLIISKGCCVTRVLLTSTPDQ